MRNTYKFFALIIIFIAFANASAFAQCSYSVTATNSGPVCKGDSVTFTATITGTPTGTTQTYNWVGPGSFTSTLQSPKIIANTAGVYAVFVTDSTGCSDAPATSTLVVNTSPVAITGSSNICLGSSVVFGDTSTYAVDSPSFALLPGIWSSSNTTIATVSTYGAVTGNTTDTISALSVGVDTITYTLGDGCATSKIVNVDSIPVITGSLKVCNTTTLSGGFSGGTWTSSNPAVATVNSAGVVTGISLGTANITYTLAAGCVADTAVTVLAPAAPIEGPSSLSLCTGTDTTLTDISSSTGTWSVSSPSVASIDSTTGQLAAISGGMTLVSYTISDGCAATDTIIVNPLPEITSSTNLCLGTTTTLISTTTGGKWSVQDTTIATIDSTTGAITAVALGGTNVTYTSDGGCSVTDTVTVNPAATPVSAPSSSLCVGTDMTLSDAPTTGGTWSTAPTAVATINALSGVLEGVSAGTVVATYLLPGGCAATDTILVNPLPIITGSVTVCAGHTVTLTGDPADGTWGSSNSGVATITLFSGLLTGVSSGTTQVTYTSDASCTSTKTITVNPSPSVITGSSEVCSGSDITLSDSTTGGSWSALPSTVANINATNGLLAGVSQGTVVVTYVLSGGCKAMDTIVVEPLPVIIGSGNLCLNLATALSASPSGGAWSTSNTAVASITTTGVVTGIAIGTDTITYVSVPGCVTSKTVVVNPLPGPISGETLLCAASSTTFTDDTSGGTWSTKSSAVATIDGLTGTLTATGAGKDTVIYTLPTGCVSTDTVRVDPLPAMITGADSICYGLTTTLSTTTTGGLWSSSNTGVAIINGFGTVSTVSVGADTIRYTLSTGCVRNLPIRVNPLPATITGASTVCVDASVSLIETSDGGTWSITPSAVATVTASSGILTGVSSGTATVTYTLPTSCMISEGVTVNPIPDAIGGVLAVCASGDTTDLTETTSPGTWSISPTSLATINSSTGVATGISAGTATVSFTLPVTGCYMTAAFTVNPLPLPVTGTGTVCASSTVLLSDATGSGTWIIAPLSVATISNAGMVTGISEGTATVTYELGTGCLVTDTIQIDPQPDALITPLGDTMICGGSFVALTATTGPGLTYQWLDPSAIPGATSSTYVASTAGNYAVQVTNSLGCSRTTIPMEVTVDSLTTSISTAGSTTECEGQGITLTDNITTGGYNYQWQRNGVSISGADSFNHVVTDSSGLYRVVVSNGTGCSATSNAIDVTVNPLPADTITSYGNLNFCTGSSVLLVADPGPGYVYQWYFNSVIIAGANSISYTATATGAYEVEITNSYGCSGFAGVNAIELPLPLSVITSANPTTFCPGGSDTLEGPSGSGYFYQWFNNGIALTGDTSSFYVDSTSGNFTLVVTGPGPCNDTTPTPTVITEIPQPVIEPLTSTSFCWGGSFTLSENISAATGVASYQWYRNGELIAGATGALYSSSTPGYYSCFVSAGSCSTNTDSVTITEYPLPNPLISFDGMNLHTEDFYVTYQWQKDLIPITGATDSFVTPASNGSYQVYVTDTNGCQSESDAYVLSDLNVKNVNSIDVNIYPNPAQGILHITSPINVRAQINSIDGRVILTQDGAKNVDIHSVADGTYIIVLYDDNGQIVKTEKIVKTSN